MKLTSVNQFALREWIKQGCPQRVEATAHPHLKRCIKMGYIELRDGQMLPSEKTRQLLAAPVHYSGMHCGTDNEWFTSNRFEVTCERCISNMGKGR